METILGLDILGAGSPHFDFDLIEKHVPRDFALGMFFEEFGPAMRRIKQAANWGFKTFRIQMDWSSHKIVKKRALKKRCKKIEAFVLEHPELTVYISHSTECNDTRKKKVRKRVRIMQKFAPSCIPINNPGHLGVYLPNFITERHDHSGYLDIEHPYLVSNDGADFKEDVTRRMILKHDGHAKIIFAWRPEFNMVRQGSNEHNTPPKNRMRTTIKHEIKEVVNKLKNFR